MPTAVSLAASVPQVNSGPSVPVCPDCASPDTVQVGDGLRVCRECGSEFGRVVGCTSRSNRGAEIKVRIHHVEFSTLDPELDPDTLSELLGVAVPGDWFECPCHMLHYGMQKLGPGGAKILWGVERPEVHVILPGKWCDAVGPDSFRDFISWVCDVGKVCRLDLAGDDESMAVRPEDVLHSWLSGEKVSHIKKVEIMESWYGVESKGKTLYLGSFNSRQMVRVYDKSAESDGEVNAIRWELQERNEYADQIARSLAVDDWGHVWASWLVRAVDFREVTACSNVTYRPRCEWFAYLVASARKAIVVLAVPVVSFERAKAWVWKYAMPVVSAVFHGMGGDVNELVCGLDAGRVRWRERHRVIAGCAA